MPLKSNVPQAQRMTIAVLTAALLAVFIPTRVTHAQASPPASYTFEECDQVKASDLRDELNRITQAVFEEEQGGIDIGEIVERNWNALDLDATVDAAVATATEQVKEATGYWDLLISGWDPEKAKELTEIVASRAFTLTTLSDAMNQLSQNVADDIVAEIRRITAMSASSALLCVQTFIGDTISPTMSSVLEQEIQTGLEEHDPHSDAEVDFLDIAMSKPHLLGGVGVIVVSQIAKGLGKKLAQSIAGKAIVRVLGRVGTTVVPVVGWIVGTVLVVWDLWKAREGSLPLIRDALQDKEVKQEIRRHVTEQVKKELRLELPHLARDIANSVYSRWQEFRGKYARVLELAENHERFRNILDNTAVAEVQKLADFATLIEDRFGLERLKALIDEAHFERLLALPKETRLLLEHVDDPQAAIDWADLAGELITKVIEMEFYRVGSPTDLRDRAELERIVALDSAELVRTVMLLERDVRDSMLGLPTADVAQILTSHTVDELSLLARDFLIELDPANRNLLVDRILRQPGITKELKVDSVRTAILNFGDIGAVLNYVGKRTDESLWLGKTLNMFGAVGPAILGELPVSLFWHYDGRIFLNVLYVLAGLIALLVLWRRVKSIGKRILLSLLRKPFTP